MTATAPRLRHDRLVAPDVLRGVAVAAMLVAHAMPLVPSARTGVVGFLAWNVNDLASPLFALVMGMSAALVLARPGASPGRVLLRNAIRGAVLVALGVWLETWGSWIAIVLQYLGVVLVLGTPLLLLRSRTIAALAAVLALAAGPVNAAVAATASGSPLALWLFTGPSYRATNLLPFFLLGALLLRHGAQRNRLLPVLAAVAVVAYPVRPLVALLLGVESPSGSLPDTLHDLGLVLLAYVAVVLLTTSRSTAVQRLLVPLRAIGTLALSVYVLQVALVAALARAGLGYSADTPLAALALVLGLCAAAVLWWRFLGAGPVERLTARLSGLVPR
ncbi:acyltransferase family protein [Rathayibacter sp. AY1F3]|uniref:acyltransferase family protein n=1 Tax=Rathayibacter sp. AY1F3 TaxID=2080558 RepID=UPI0011B06DCE|nr:acyltransferase family protein [Rathayibacter sp. AY1F3]